MEDLPREAVGLNLDQIARVYLHARRVRAEAVIGWIAAALQVPLSRPHRPGNAQIPDHATAGAREFTRCSTPNSEFRMLGTHPTLTNLDTADGDDRTVARTAGIERPVSN